MNEQQFTHGTPMNTTVATPDLRQEDMEAVRRLKDAFADLKAQLGRVIVGQDQVIEELLIALFSRGHCILEGVPGLAKTLMISTLAKCLSLAFSRIQFTPDLMPSDITGTEVIEENRSTGQREFKFIAGPAVRQHDPRRRNQPHAAEDAGRPARSDAGAAGHRRPGAAHASSDPFFVLATQNPIEQEGTYPLPEAQQDRFMFKVFVQVSAASRKSSRSPGARPRWSMEEVGPCLSGEQIIELQQLVRRVPVTDHVIHYTLALVRQTRLSEPGVPKFIREWLSWGAGPRAVQYLDSRRQGTGAALRPGPRADRRHPGPGFAGAAASHPDELHRRLGRHHHRQGHREAARGNAEQGRRVDHATSASGRSSHRDHASFGRPSRRARTVATSETGG